MEDVALLVVLASYLAFIVLDFVRPARSFTRIRFWRLKGLAFFFVSMAIGTVLPFVWAGFVERHRVLDLWGLGAVGGAAVGFVVLQLFAYWWHRAMHSVNFLWRWFHQMHHSAERVDIFGAMYFHPLDIAGFTAVQGLVLGLLLGVSAPAAALAGAFGLFAALFQHANIRTPRWVAAFVQRPEAHALHHGRGVHAFNYADFPLWDALFGTLRNPASWQGQAGFHDGASKRVGAMLIGRDVAEAPLGRPQAAKPQPLAA
jgi:sterol desaturase/sphingolipid hydroxylase (fatty acid hydroxylase superfamily)